MEEELSNQEMMDARRAFLLRCNFEPVYGQHFTHACNELAREAKHVGIINDYRFSNVAQFYYYIASICIFKQEREYLIEFERHNHDTYALQKIPLHPRCQ